MRANAGRALAPVPGRWHPALTAVGVLEKLLHRGAGVLRSLGHRRVTVLHAALRPILVCHLALVGIGDRGRHRRLRASPEHDRCRCGKDDGGQEPPRRSPPHVASLPGPGACRDASVLQVPSEASDDPSQQHNWWYCCEHPCRDPAAGARRRTTEAPGELADTHHPARTGATSTEPTSSRTPDRCQAPGGRPLSSYGAAAEVPGLFGHCSQRYGAERAVPDHRF